MLRLRLHLLIPFVLAFLWLGVSSARAARPIVAGFERFHTGPKAELTRGGQLLLNELNCTRCHNPSNGGPGAPGETLLGLAPKQGPILDEVGSRVRVGHLRQFLSNPHSTKPGTTMPDLLAGDPDRKDKVEALVHFLVSASKDQKPKHERPQSKTVNEGRDLYHKSGCVACHGTRNAQGEADKRLSTSIPLGDLKTKYTIPSLGNFLADPLHSRPSGRMPKVLDAKESRKVAHYLLQATEVQLPTGRGTVRYYFYEGDWKKLPNFTQLKPKAEGTTKGLSLEVARRESNYALKFTGVLPVEKAGKYTFTLNSDDGSQLFIGDKLVVDNDGIHPAQSRSANIKLTSGVHPLMLTFFQGGGEAVLEATVSGPGFDSLPLGDLIVASEAELQKKAEPAVSPDHLVLDPGQVKKGRELFASLGCASCHSFKQQGKPLVSSLKAPALNKLTGAKGCLADKVPSGLPNYDLAEDQRRALTAALGEPVNPKNPGNRPAAEVIRDTLTAFNCMACHVRAEQGGPQEELNKWFQSVQPEMGDEGRIPPPLDGVGAKLREDYFRQILEQGAHDRPYMYTRMPGFGAGTTTHLVPLFKSLDKLPEAPKFAWKESVGKVKSAARHLVGPQGMACIKCHTFAGKKAEGIQGIDMLKMPQRLTYDWFHAYILDPQKIRPGTRMPSVFLNGKSVFPEILNGGPDQIEAQWLYLSDGPKAQLPIGLGKSFIPLEAKGNAVLYRNFIAGAGPRAIGVGYPEKLNLAFDANDLRIALLWQGAFIDAARHWTDRGSGYEGPLGENILALNSGAPFAVLDKPDTAWPTGSAKSLGWRFRGYKTSKDDRPTFLYSLGELSIEDFPNPIDDKSLKTPLLQRTLRITLAKAQAGASAGLTYRAVVGKSVEEKADGTYRVDGAWTLKVSGPLKAQIKGQIRTVGATKELLIPVTLREGKAEIILEYMW